MSTWHTKITFSFLISTLIGNKSYYYQFQILSPREMMLNLHQRSLLL